MRASADLVVVGHIAEYGISRSIQGDAAEDVVTYSLAEVVVDSVVSGDTSPGSKIPVEFLLTAITPKAAAVQVEGARAELTNGDSLLLFLRAKRFKEEAGLYRLVNSSGLWQQVGTGLVAPLADPLDAGKYRAETSGAATVAELAVRVR
jgi:hypothetical protein